VRPVICLITDGRLSVSDGEAALVERVAAAARAGVDLIQIREAAIDDRMLAAMVSGCLHAVRGTRARVVVNDRLDVALACGAHGVHLKSTSYPAARARAVAPAGFLIGRSIHSAEDATRAEGADYVVFGSIFVTSSKPGQTPAGLAALAQTVRATPLPVLAVGGVTVETAGLLSRTGVAGVAAIGLFANQPTAALSAVVQSLTQAFDGPQSGP
jgi:thiamine-phosphate pyrophosphorylase